MPKTAKQNRPTHVGMNRGRQGQTRGRRKPPHARGDEPLFVPYLRWLTRTAPRTWG